METEKKGKEINDFPFCVLCLRFYIVQIRNIKLLFSIDFPIHRKTFNIIFSLCFLFYLIEATIKLKEKISLCRFPFFLRPFLTVSGSYFASHIIFYIVILPRRLLPAPSAATSRPPCAPLACM